MIEIRFRNRVSQAELAEKVGKILTDADYNMALTGPTRLVKPDGRPLAVYLPGAVESEMRRAYPILTQIRASTENRGQASGVKRVMVARSVGALGLPRTRAKPVQSSLLGAFEAAGHFKYCRLTAFTARETDAWVSLRPLFRAIAGHFAKHVPDRYHAQVREARATDPAWTIPGTPFSTITVNNTWPTGVHQDKGDLDAGFSCLAVCRRGPYRGGRLTFPEYRVAVDLHDGDLVLMDAHEWHGNTRLICACGNELDRACPSCGAERISIVCYYRTEMARCGTPADEAERARHSRRDVAVFHDEAASVG